MQQNAFYKKSDDKSNLNLKAEAHGEVIAKKVLEKSKGVYRHSGFIEVIVRLLYPVLFKPLLRNSFKKVSGLNDTHSLDMMMHHADHAFEITESCTGCGICVDVCAVGNILIKEDKPVFLHQCENCLACYNWCPNQAIQTSLCHEGYYYQNTCIHLAEMMIKNKPQ